MGGYRNPEAPEKPELDWSHTDVRRAHLRQLVEDAQAALALAPTNEQHAAVQKAAALLTTVVADDVEEGPPAGPKRRGRPPSTEKPAPPARDGEPEAPMEETGPRLRQGVVQDRVFSVVDPGMRYGHKSQRQHWPGYKRQVSEEQTSEPIMHVEVRPANEHVGEPVVSFMAWQKAQVGLQPDALLCAGAYGTVDAREDRGERGIEVVTKLRPITDTKHWGKDLFILDLTTNSGPGSVPCPAGVTTTDFRRARDQKDRAVRHFRFPAETCRACSLREHRLGGPSRRAEHPIRKSPGRRVQLPFHEDVLQAARAAQKTVEQRRALRDRLRPRAKVERKISELYRPHALRHACYRGRQKTKFQAVLPATMGNIKRLTLLSSNATEREERIRAALAA